ncbi:MAG: hypothetical protein ABEI97_05055, partial [Candidatus Nanohaloarchaea archaeon]
MPLKDIIHEPGKFLYHGYSSLWSLPFRILPQDGIYVTAEEWDMLIVLDACRYDTFKELNTIPGELKKVKSRATSTPQWLERNFSGDQNDIVYAAGNPFVSGLANDGGFDLE